MIKIACCDNCAVRKVMNKIIFTGFIIFSIISLSACSMIEQEMEVNQKIVFYSYNNELLLTVTDNEEITSFTQSHLYEQWDYSVNWIPVDAMKICTYVTYLERDGQMREEAKETMYYDDNGYYMLIETPMITTQIKMSNAAALHIIDLLGLDLSNTTTTFAIDHPDKIADYYPFKDFTYEGMLDASVDNRIEICEKDGEIIRNISNNEEIYSFITSLYTSKWTYVDHIPDNADQEGTFIFYQRGRKEYKNQMMEQWRQVLYFDGQNYYIDMPIADIGYADDNNQLAPKRYLIPEQTGKMLSEIIGSL